MKTPTRSPTHADVELSRLSAMGLEVEDIADDGEVTIPALVELAEDRGRPVSHYLAAIPLGDDVHVAGTGPVLKICAGSCQQWGALDLLDHVVERWQSSRGFKLARSRVSIAAIKRPRASSTATTASSCSRPRPRPRLDEALDH